MKRKNAAFSIKLVRRLCLASGVAAFFAAVTCFANAEDAVSFRDNVFAHVGGEEVALEEYQAALHQGMRQRFYHGQVPEAELQAYRREIAGQVVDRVLLRQEAKKRGIQPERDKVEAELARYVERFQKHPAWEKEKDILIPGWRSQLEEESVVALLEAQIKAVESDHEDELVAFYNDNKEKFTIPQRQRLSLVLLSVAPSAGGQAWRDALAQAQAYVAKLRTQELDFQELAEDISGHSSASKGGDLGVIHQGMLSPEAEKVVDALSEGEISDPLMLLQGVAIFRLVERIPPKLNAYEDVKGRVESLMLREKRAQVWQNFLEQLRAKVETQINESIL